MKPWYLALVPVVALACGSKLLGQASTVSVDASAPGVAPPSVEDAGTDDAGAEDAQGPPLSDDSGAVVIDSDSGHVSYLLPFRPGPFTSGFSINVGVGGGAAHEVVVDTGSVGLVVPSSALGPDVTSTGQTFTLEYTSDGLIFSGTIEIAQITLGVADAYKGGVTGGLPVTVPMSVRVVTSASCDPKYKNCQVPPSLDSVGVLGVGFGRGDGPSANALLMVQEIDAGAMHAGYVLSEHPPQLQVGLPSDTSDFAKTALAPGDAGDWASNSLTGCATAPSTFAQMCGEMLVDTGIDYCIVAFPAGQVPSSDGGFLGKDARVILVAPAPDGGAMSDTFFASGVQPNDAPAVSLRVSLTGAPFINTGRRLLSLYDYLFDAQEGLVGFRDAGI